MLSQVKSDKVVCICDVSCDQCGCRAWFRNSIQCINAFKTSYKSEQINLQYEGQWKDGEFHGSGTLKLKNGYVYTGHFADGKYDGRGTYTFAEDGCYVFLMRDLLLIVMIWFTVCSSVAHHIFD